MPIRTELLSVGPLGTNCYFLIDDVSARVVIIDPGAEAERIASYLDDRALTLVSIINTHGHADHIGANYFLKVHFNDHVRIFIHEADAPMLTDPLKNLSVQAGAGKLYSPEADVLLKDGDNVPLHGTALKVIHTPGHTPGSICLLLEGEALFTGDTLFAGTAGRTDLPGGDEAALVTSLAKLRTFSPSLKVYPGHEAISTMKDELRDNPFLS